jgi:hypothetical protein
MPSNSSQTYTLFEYLYRDAGNFKAHGMILLSGQISQAERGLIESKLESGEFFIAEQIGIRPLYDALYQYSGGMTDQDHVWHSSEGFRAPTGEDLIDSMDCWGTVHQFVEMFARVERWSLRLSAHAMLIPERV